jgi:lysosomal Pro-X carboxypeptidase
LVVYGEHRYFGQSIPFGWSKEEALKKGNNQFLSTENALADMSQLIKVVKEKYQAQDSPVIAFGGSYGGMLAAWMRIKYPE